MKIMRVQKDGGEPVWAVNEGDDVYVLEGDVYAAPKKGKLIGPVASVKMLSPILPHNTPNRRLKAARGEKRRAARSRPVAALGRGGPAAAFARTDPRLPTWQGGHPGSGPTG